VRPGDPAEPSCPGGRAGSLFPGASRGAARPLRHDARHGRLSRAGPRAGLQAFRRTGAPARHHVLSRRVHLLLRHHLGLHLSPQVPADTGFPGRTARHVRLSGPGAVAGPGTGRHRLALGRPLGRLLLPLLFHPGHEPQSAAQDGRLLHAHGLAGYPQSPGTLVRLFAAAPAGPVGPRRRSPAGRGSRSASSPHLPLVRHARRAVHPRVRDLARGPLRRHAGRSLGRPGPSPLGRPRPHPHSPASGPWRLRQAPRLAPPGVPDTIKRGGAGNGGGKPPAANGRCPLESLSSLGADAAVGAI